MIHYRRRKSFVLMSLLVMMITLIMISYLHFTPKEYPRDYSPLRPVIHPYDRSNDSNNSSDASFPRVLCLILTSPKTLLTLAKAVNGTWAPRCTGYYFILEYDSNTLQQAELEFARQLPIAPIENITAGYDHLTQKTTLAFLFAYEHHFDDFDWFIKADDDTYLFVDHLQIFLSDKNTSDPVTYGYNFKVTISM